MGHDGRMTAAGFIRQEALCVGEDELSVIDGTMKKNECFWNYLTFKVLRSAWLILTLQCLLFVNLTEHR